jgi:transposase
LPKDLPPKSTVHDYLELWNWDGTLERIHHSLYVAVREQAGREASSTISIGLACSTSFEPSYVGSKSTTPASRSSSGSHHQMVHRDQDHQPILGNIVQALVERTFAWISRNRRLARDFERYAATVTAFIRLAMIRIMLRRLAANASS